MNQLTNLPSADISAQHEQDAKDLTRILDLLNIQFDEA